jgi:uncharacterized repeat protein (TIGR03843 family)
LTESGEPLASGADPPAAALEVLAHGQVEIEGRMPWSSNATFLVTVTLGEVTVPAIYKPGRGERPLWDFEGGLYQREVAAYALSEELGWGLVPPTVRRADAPLGEGSLQLFVDADFEQHYFTLLEDEAHHPALRRLATFDLIANNADRKSGHCLIDREGRLWGIDHGLCFHQHPKLRTVMWDFEGQPLPAEMVTDLRALAARSAPPASLVPLLSAAELDALMARAKRIVARGVFPRPTGDHPYPWPLV